MFDRKSKYTNTYVSVHMQRAKYMLFAKCYGFVKRENTKLHLDLSQ